MDEHELAVWDGRFAVVDAQQARYLGTVRVRGGGLSVLTGMAGRPPVVAAADVDSITDAEGHPDVVDR